MEGVPQWATPPADEEVLNISNLRQIEPKQQLQKHVNYLFV